MSVDATGPSITMDPMGSPPKEAARRLSAEERREHVLAAAMREFADHGFHAASTAAIAQRAGISQPYIYALFPNKKELFLACHQRVVRRIRDAFVAAADGAPDPAEALRRMGGAYAQLVEDRFELLAQLQGYAATGDDEIRAEVSRCFAELYDEVARVSGAPREDVKAFFAKGMYLNVAMALDLPAAYRPEPPGVGPDAAC